MESANYKKVGCKPIKIIMNIIPRRPFNELDDFFRDDDWFFPVFSRKGFDPDMDVYETEKDVVAEVSVPNINPDDVKVSVEDGVLRVVGEFEEKEEERGEDKNYWRKEISRGSFQRAVRLPCEVDEEKTEATYEKGVLKVVLPKREPKEKKAKEIKVKSK